MRHTKRTVTCRVTVDGELMREVKEKKVVYVGSKGRYVTDASGLRYPLDEFDTYEYAYSSKTLFGVDANRFSGGDS